MDTVKAALRVIDHPVVSVVLKALLVAYGALIVPTLTVDQGHWFHNVYVRALVVALVLWTALGDPALGIGIATVFYLGSYYVSKASMNQIIQTGKVEGLAGDILAGGVGPSAKTHNMTLKERFVMQASVDEGMFNPPADDAQDVHGDAIETILKFKDDQQKDWTTTGGVGTDSTVDRTITDPLEETTTTYQSDLAPLDFDADVTFSTPAPVAAPAPAVQSPAPAAPSPVPAAPAVVA
ncbi:hypothetical protein GGF32_006387 [Allomyces javanicus]|nr:hypothetical protein GGF32_006387 [Allomyces javanicus]